MILDEQGYLRLTDFGISKFFKKENSQETSGTPGYMAPEIMCGLNHSFVSDYFAIGVFGYEMIFGKVNHNLFQRPYYGRSRKEVKENILSRQEKIKLDQIPDGWSHEAIDFINKV